MVGWNIAVTQLVAEQVLHKISNLVYFTSEILFTVNDYDEHVECLYECMFLPLCMINNCVCVCSTSMHFVSTFYECTCSWGWLPGWLKPWQRPLRWLEGRGCYSVNGLLATTLQLGIHHLDVFLDSQLLVSQLNNYYQVRDPCLFRKFLCTKQMVRAFESITFTHVPRNLNSIANHMANDILNWHFHNRIQETYNQNIMHNHI